jgi:hypothetical protein
VLSLNVACVCVCNVREMGGCGRFCVVGAGLKANCRPFGWGTELPSPRAHSLRTASNHTITKTLHTTQIRERKAGSSRTQYSIHNTYNERGVLITHNRRKGKNSLGLGLLVAAAIIVQARRFYEAKASLGWPVEW